MKRTFFIYLSLILGYYTGTCQNQNEMLQSLEYVKMGMNLPYKFCEDTLPAQPVGFPIDNFIGTSFKNSVWTDLALTQEEAMKTDSGSNNIWPTCEIGRKFKTDNRNFILFSVFFGAFDFEKYSLVTIDTNGNYIDSIEIGATIFAKDGNYYYSTKWEITEDMTVKTYQLKPTSSTPILYNSDIPDTIHAERIDRTYKIGSNGKFTEVEKKFYKPKSYPKEKFLDKSYDISTGNEIYIKPLK